MSDFHLYVLCLISGITIISIILALKRKSHFTYMSGMIVSMFLGMNVGLTAGVTFGVVYQGDLFLSTILGMAFGILSGSFCGSCFGLLSSLEGLMSGLMGGMMGAMLGEMVAVEQANVFIKIFLLILMSTIFLLIILTTPNKATIKNRSWFLKPVSTLLLSGLVIFFGISLSMEKAESKSLIHDHEQDRNNDFETQKDIVIETSGMNYSPEEVVVERNKSITLVLKNSDQIEHDIEIKGVSFNVMSTSTHQHDVKENVIHLHAEPQTTSNISFTINEVGVYEFYCTVPGHKENGMIGQFVVK
ncbi:multicopper oxidase domain-containing protein [Paenisporosarcina macmurdoensis]|uniref:Multicopper oxidase domain-containing protein n=1 Tax=Paenisporosarcina macmurdoensis TaxID=212659 RepID=A0ABW1L430_9BACL